MEPLEPYLEIVTTEDHDHHKLQRKATRCPVCTRLDTLRMAKGMVLCTHCFWAMEMKQAG